MCNQKLNIGQVMKEIVAAGKFFTSLYTADLKSVVPSKLLFSSLPSGLSITFGARGLENLFEFLCASENILWLGQPKAYSNPKFFPEVI